VPLLREQVAHFAPIPDPSASYRGMSWLTPIVREIMADGAATTHKLKFFENGATPNLVVTLGDPSTSTRRRSRSWVDVFEGDHEGVLNAYKTLYLANGASAEVVGANLRQLDFKNTQGAGETRIAAAAGVPPVIVGLSEGLQAATYSNYGQARRRFADGTIRPLWRNFAGSLATIINVPPAPSSGTTTATSPSCRRTSRTPPRSRPGGADDQDARRGRLRARHRHRGGHRRRLLAARALRPLLDPAAAGDATTEPTNGSNGNNSGGQ
jgi:hypothetical protein